MAKLPAKAVGVRLPTAPKTNFNRWSKLFLAELAITSNVSASAKKAGISTSTAYETRRTNPEFNRRWQVALCEGYDHLEMELLHRLVERAGAGQLRLTEMAALFWYCLADNNQVPRELVGEAVIAAGLAESTKPLRIVLSQILQGGG